MHPTTLRSLQWLAIILVITGSGVAYFLTRTKAAVTINTSQNTQQTGNLVGLWSFNGPDVSGTTAYDRSGASHNGTLTNGSAPAIGKVGQALNFDGTDQYVSIGTVYNGVQSISFWIKASNVTQKIIDLGGSTNIEVIGQTITANGFTSPTIYVDGAVSSFIDTNWHFVTITTGTGINASAVNIGRVSSSYFNGRLDEVRMYSNAVSSSQIANLYSSGGSVPGVIPPPIISAISYGTPSYTGATITWTTNTISTSYVEYGTTTGYGTTIGSATPVTSHSVALSGFTSATTYHFRVHSVNASGQEGLSADNTFVTGGPTVAISAISSGTPSYYTATITWTTDVTSDSYVDYGTTTGYGTTVGSATLVTSHSVALSGLTGSTTYHFRVHSSKAGSFNGISGDNTFTTAFLCGSTITFTYNGGSVTYGTVTGADTKCWMDRNLGATRVATSSTDYLAYGSLFQWGRRADGHQLITWTNSTTGTPVNGSIATLADVPANSLFITNGASPYDWRVNQDGTLWANSSSTNNPCPASWHVPLQTEWAAWVTAASVTNSATAYSSTLKLTLAGQRHYSSAGLLYQGSSGYYWSSSPNGSLLAYLLYFQPGDVNPAMYNYRAFGFSVRCVKD